MGIINNLGKFDRDLDTPRIRGDNGVYEYVLAWKDETQIDRDVTLTEIDIENLIRAKGAIYSGCMTLLTEVGMSISDIEHIILAGGFGSYVDLEKPMTIGLLPEMDPDKVTFIRVQFRQQTNCHGLFQVYITAESAGQNDVLNVGNTHSHLG